MPSDGKSSLCLWQGELKKLTALKLEEILTPFKSKTVIIT
jgi:hypothetical protein